METTPNVLSVFGEYAESIYAYIENTTNLEVFAVLRIVSEYAESIQTYTENTRKVFKRIWRICQRNLTVFSLYANRQKIDIILANFNQNPKYFRS